MHNYLGEQMHIICIHTCILYTYIHAYVYIYTYIGTYIHTYMHTCICTYIYVYTLAYIHTCMQEYIHTYTGVQGGSFQGFVETLFNFYTLLKPEAYLGILMHKYWDRNHCMNATLPLVVNKRYKGVLRVWLRNALSTRKGIILSNISVKHFNRAITLINFKLY